MGAVEGRVREDLPGKMMTELKSNKCEMGRDDETSVGTVFLLIYLSENCQKGSSTKYPFVIMSV